MPDIKYNGCSFHFLKNIRKFLMKNGFTKKGNENHIKYLMNNVYSLPFKSKINKSIDN